MIEREHVISIKSVYPVKESAATEEQYAELCAAIVEKAVIDYVKVMERLWSSGIEDKTRQMLVIEKTDIESFFFSQWFEALSNIDPTLLVNQCLVLAKEQTKKAAMRRNQKRIREELMLKNGIPDANTRFRDYMNNRYNDQEKVGKTNNG